MKNVQKEKNEIQTKQEKIISTILCHQWKKKLNQIQLSQNVIICKYQLHNFAI